MRLITLIKADLPTALEALTRKSNAPAQKCHVFLPLITHWPQLVVHLPRPRRIISAIYLPVCFEGGNPNFLHTSLMTVTDQIMKGSLVASSLHSPHLFNGRDYRMM